MCASFRTVNISAVIRALYGKKHMHVLFVIVGVIAIIVFYLQDYKKRDAVARVEGLAPLSRHQLRKMRRAANNGTAYTPRRRAYGSAPRLPPPFNRKS